MCIPEIAYSGSGWDPWCLWRQGLPAWGGGHGLNKQVENVALTFNPYVGSCRDGKDKEKEDEDERLQVVCSHSLDPKEDRA